MAACVVYFFGKAQPIKNFAETSHNHLVMSNTCIPVASKMSQLLQCNYSNMVIITS